MKKRLLISMALALLLVILVPSMALAAKPVSFNVGGYVTGIDEGSVAPAGDSGRYRVMEREITGVALGPSIMGDFVLNYKGNVDLATQAGNIHGRVTIGEYVFEMNGKTLPLEWLQLEPYPVAQLSIIGHCTLIGAKQGTGNLDASVVFIPTPDGHVYMLLGGSFALAGQWQQ